MKISSLPNSRYFSLSTLAILFLIISTNAAHAWEGYDYESRDRIDIGPGNLVREGLAIQFYDINADDYHTAKVVLMESVAGGTRITMQDLDTKKERIFIMQQE